MAIIVKDKGGEGFEPVAAGTYVARCVSVVDIGIQDTPWGNKEKIRIAWEIPAVRIEWKDQDGKDHSGPALISKTYTASLNEKSWLGQHLESWRGKPFTEEERNGFDIMNILGAPCMISIVHETSKKGKTYAAVKSIMKLPQGTECPPAETELLAYSPADNSLIGNFEKLPEFLQKLCKEGHGAAADYPVTKLASGDEVNQAEPPLPGSDSADPESYFDDDIPF